MRSFYVQVVFSDAEAIAAGYAHSMVLKQDGSVWVTGKNDFGQLGNGHKTFESKFVQVISSGTQVVAAGDQHSMVLKYDGSVWATGANQDGQLGDGSTISTNEYVRVLPLDAGA